MQKTLSLLVTECEESLLDSVVEVAVDGVAECELCLIDSPVYEFGRVCCRVRYIIGEPRLEVRRAWLERWKNKNHVLGEKVEREVTARWVLKK